MPLGVLFLSLLVITEEGLTLPRSSSAVLLDSQVYTQVLLETLKGARYRTTQHRLSSRSHIINSRTSHRPRDIPSLTIHNKLPTSKCLGKSGTDARPFGSEAGQPLSD
jgi:hypothetical protein